MTIQNESLLFMCVIYRGYALRKRWDSVEHLLCCKGGNCVGGIHKIIQFMSIRNEKSF